MNKYYTRYNILYYIFVVIVLYIIITNAIQSFKCPQMTQMELFLHIPKSIMLDWVSCDNRF